MENTGFAYEDKILNYSFANMNDSITSGMQTWSSAKISLELAKKATQVALDALITTVNQLATVVATKQSQLTFDSTPTSGSSNPVTSDGIYNTNRNLSNRIQTNTNSINAHEIILDKLYQLDWANAQEFYFFETSSPYPRKTFTAPSNGVLFFPPCDTTIENLVYHQNQTDFNKPIESNPAFYTVRLRYVNGQTDLTEAHQSNRQIDSTHMDIATSCTPFILIAKGERIQPSTQSLVVGPTRYITGAYVRFVPFK